MELDTDDVDADDVDAADVDAADSEPSPGDPDGIFHVHFDGGLNLERDADIVDSDAVEPSPDVQGQQRLAHRGIRSRASWC